MGRMVLLEFPYETLLTQEEAEELKEKAFTPPRTYNASDYISDEAKQQGGGTWRFSEPFIIDLDLFLEWNATRNYKFTILKIQNPAPLEFQVKDNGPAFNAKVSVAVPDLGLLLIQQAEVMEDCCTDLLNRRLAEGWRILAICPQPNQRRPDYILGTTKKEL